MVIRMPKGLYHDYLSSIRSAISFADNVARELSLFHFQRLPEELKDGLRPLDDGAGAGVATLEKYVCARASHFLGTAHSTFSWDILRIRVATSRASCKDGLLPMGNTS